MVLLAILGAGASHDSLPIDVLERLTVEDIEEFRPPLAQGLFEDRRSFGKALDKYGQGAALIHSLRRAVVDGRDLEQELERSQEESESYPPLLRQLMAVRFYLQEILWTCGNTWRDMSHGVTNYARLMSRLDKWRYANNERICFATFNYDLMMDEAAVNTLGADLHSVEAYASDDRNIFVKLHGSVNWGRRVQSPGGVHYSKPDHARRILIEGAESLDLTDDFVLRSPEDSPSDSSPYASILMPAITIPVQSKTDFECPDSHLVALDKAIRETFRILVIGWRGMERHFLPRLKALPGMAPAVAIVGISEDGTRETAQNLASVGLAESKMWRFTEGFANFLESRHLEDFLNTEIAEWSG